MKIEVIGIFLAVLIPFIGFSFAYPKSYSKFKISISAWFCYLWLSFIFMVMIVSALETFGVIKILVKKWFLFDFIEKLSGVDIVPVIVIPPLLVFFIFHLIGMVSKFRELE